MYLVYINKIGTSFNGEHMFEFLFTNDLENMDFPESWYNSSTYSDKKELAPNEDYIDLIGHLKTTEIDLELIQDSGVFDVYNAVEDIVSLGWEKLSVDDDFDTRMIFKYGQKQELVEAILLMRDLELTYKKQKHYNG
jgi:hypothetical protein